MPRTAILRWVTSCTFLCLLTAGCGEKGALQNALSTLKEHSGVQPASASSADQPLRIGSFNIQVFGTTKMSKPQVVKILVDVARQFDVLAIQEIRSKDDQLMPQFLELVNSEGAHFDFVVGPRLGRSNSTEQYAFLFNTDRIEVDAQRIYTIHDPDDLLHREPYVVRFRARGMPTGQAFSFTLVNIHTDPDETDTELDALADVFLAVRQDGSGEDDVIVLGDLNVDEHHLGKLGSLPGIQPAITGIPTNTRGTKTYDNIVLDGRTTREFLGRAGVLNLLERYNLSETQALEVSDHLPVWAEFSRTEAAAENLARRSPDGVQ